MKGAHVSLSCDILYIFLSLRRSNDLVISNSCGFFGRKNCGVLCAHLVRWLDAEFISIENKNLYPFKPTRNERAIGDCILAKICYYNAHCNGDSENWSIVDYIDVWLVWKPIGLHVLADDANALYPLFTHSTCLVTWWPSYWTFELENWQGSVLSQDSSVYEILWS